MSGHWVGVAAPKQQIMRLGRLLTMRLVCIFFAVSLKCMFGIAILGLKAYTAYCLCVYLQASVQLTLLFPPCSIYCTITVEPEIQDSISPPFLYLNIFIK